MTLANSSPMDIREATDHDADAVADLWTEAYSEDRRGGRMDPYDAADFRSAAETGQVLVAADRETVAGVVVLYPSGVREGQVARPGEVELSRLAVASGFRGRGLGRQLVQACLAMAEGSGSEIVLWSHPHQVEAHQLYGSLGFSRMPDRDDSIANGPRLIFGRTL